VPEKDAGELACAIEELLTNPELRLKFAAEGRKKAEREFDVSKNVAQLHKIFLQRAPSAKQERLPKPL